MPKNNNISEAIQEPLGGADDPPSSTILAQDSSRVPNDLQTELLTIRKMRWFLVISLDIWIFLALGITSVVFCITRNPYSFSLFASITPPIYILIRITRFLFPRDDKDFRLTAMRIRKRQYR
jgi:hypothetical protein